MLTSRIVFSALFAILLTAVIALAGHFLLIRPLRKLSEAARKIAKGDFSVRIEPQRDWRKTKKNFVDVLFDDFNSMTEELSSTHEQLKALAVTDELTKLNNRRLFLEYMDLTWKQNQRLKLPVNILMIDIDYFKKYNDSLGHLEGDKALIAIAQCLKTSLKRETDFVARFGGEEFVCLLPFITKDEALGFAKTLVQNVENLKLPHPMSEASDFVTISAGMASTIPNESNSQTALLDEADKALYAAKKAGRNRVAVNEG
jgi:diguanylate cyclase (GGDEF)-like protein